MEILLPVIYLVVLIALIVALVWRARRPLGLGWYLLWLGECVAVVAAAGIGMYYDHLSGAGPLSGLTHFAETMYSFFATLVYLVLLAVTLVIHIIKLIRSKRSTGDQ